MCGRVVGGGTTGGLRVGEYIRVRFRLRPALVASPLYAKTSLIEFDVAD